MLAFQQPTKILSEILLVATYMMFSCGDNRYWFMGGVGEVILALLDDNGGDGSVEVLVCGWSSQSYSRCCHLSMGTNFTGNAQGSVSTSFTQFWSPYIKTLSPPVRLDPHGGRAVCDAGNSSEEGFKNMKGNFTCRLFLWRLEGADFSNTGMCQWLNLIRVRGGVSQYKRGKDYLSKSGRWFCFLWVPFPFVCHGLRAMSERTSFCRTPSPFQL